MVTSVINSDSSLELPCCGGNGKSPLALVHVCNNYLLQSSHSLGTMLVCFPSIILKPLVLQENLFNKKYCKFSDLQLLNSIITYK